MSVTSEHLAGSRTVGTYAGPVQLFAGEAPIITDQGVAAAPIAEYQVIALNSSGLYVPHDPTATGQPQATAAGVALFAAHQTTQPRVSLYSGGYFNHEALGWHASLTTLAQRKAAFAGLKTIKIGSLVG